MIVNLRHDSREGAKVGTTAARGLLHRRKTLEEVDLRRVYPSADLQEIIEHFWILVWDRTGRLPYRQQNVPHPTQHLVLDPQGTSGIFGLCRNRFSYDLSRAGRIIGVKFRPGMFAGFLKGPASQITDQVVPISRVFHTTELDILEQFCRMDDPTQMVPVLEYLVRRHLPEENLDAKQARNMVALIAEQRQITSLAKLSEITGKSPRSLQRMFSTYVGASPKWVIERYRIIEAVELLNRGGAGTLSQLAQDLGYFDQAHFIKSFAALTGKAPSHFNAKSLRSEKRLLPEY